MDQQQQQQPLNTSPSSRLVFKNIPRTFSEQDIRDHIILKTGKQSGNTNTNVDITEIKMLQRHNRFCGVCFIGLKSVPQAIAVQKHWNNAFFDKSRITVEFASTEQQAWSKFNPKSLLHQDQLNKLQQHSEKRQEKLSDIIANAHNPNALLNNKNNNNNNNNTQKQSRYGDKTKFLSHPALFGLSEEQKLKVLEQPKFHEFLTASQTRSKKGRSWENSTLQESFASAGIALPPGVTSGRYQTDSNGIPQISGGADEDDDDFFQGPGFNVEDNDDDSNEEENQDDHHQPLIKTVTLADQKKAKQDKKDEKEAKKKQKKLDAAASASAAVSAKKPSSDADFLRMAMGGFSSDEEDEVAVDNNKSTMDDESDDSDDDSSDSADDSSSDDDNDDDEEDNRPTKRTKNTTTTTSRNKNDHEEVLLDDLPPSTSNQDPREAILSSSSLFVRNLPFQTKEAELQRYMSEFGEIAEVAFPVDRMGNSIGYATVIFRLPEDALVAYNNVNGTLFQGRFIHIVPGNIPQSQLKNQFSDDQLNAMTHKRKKVLQLKNTAQSNYNWNSLFISQDTIANAVSAKLNIAKGQLLGADAQDDKQSAAVRMAIAETHIINETKVFLEEHGVRVDKFTSTPAGGNKTERSNNVILVKNIPFSIEETELRKLFSKYGVVDRLILPPYKTMALIEMLNPVHAKSAFLNLSYKKVKDTPIYLEWGPKDCLVPVNMTSGDIKKGGVIRINDSGVDSTGVDLSTINPDATSGLDGSTSTSPESTTIFVKNLHFNTTDDELSAHFTAILQDAYKQYVQQQHSKSQQVDIQQWRVRNSRIKRRTVTAATGFDKNKQVGEMLSLGYGFIEFSHPQAAKSALETIHKAGGTTLQGHLLALRLSKPSDMDDGALTNAGSTADLLKKKSILLQKGILSEQKLTQQQLWSQQNQKVIVRNIPFEASTSEIRETFQAFGQIKRCTLPVKPGTNQHRGYGFIEFVSPAEAKNAFEALSSTHIFGRHLVIEWAKPDDDVDDLRAQAQEAATKLRK